MSTLDSAPKMYNYPCTICRTTSLCIGHFPEQIVHPPIISASADKFVFKKQVLAEINHWAMHESYRDQKKVDLLNSLAETIEKEEWTHD